MDPEAPTRILTADEIVQDVISHDLTRSAGMEVRTATWLDNALATIEGEVPFDLVLLGLTMHGVNGLVGLRQAIDKSGGRPVAILTGNPVLRLTDDILKAGVAVFLLKKTPARSATKAIRFMQTSEQFVPMDLMRPEARTSEYRMNAPCPRLKPGCRPNWLWGFRTRGSRCTSDYPRRRLRGT